jgi:hypothetical protein
MAKFCPKAAEAAALALEFVNSPALKDIVFLK